MKHPLTKAGEYSRRKFILDAAKTCFAEKYLDFALAREVTDPVDACSIKAIGDSFSASGDLKQLVVTVASSDSFRLRLAEGVQP